MTKTQKSQPPRMIAVIADYQRTFSTAHGRRVLRRMMKECGCMEPSFIEGDPSGTSYNEGRRSAVLDICNRLKMNLADMEKQLTVQEKVDEDYID